MPGYYDVQAYHLTPDGWVTGRRPPDAVETWQRWSTRQSGRRHENVGWTSMWANPQIQRPDRNALRAHYPELMGTPGGLGDVTTTIGDPI